MAVEVLFFARAADWMGARRMSLPAAPRLKDLLARPELVPLRGRAALRFSINQAFVDESAPLKDGDEVAVLPPVSGG
jgi:molybdopterin converting factor small subunit